MFAILHPDPRLPAAGLLGERTPEADGHAARCPQSPRVVWTDRGSCVLRWPTRQGRVLNPGVVEEGPRGHNGTRGSPTAGGGSCRRASCSCLALARWPGWCVRQSTEALIVVVSPAALTGRRPRTSGAGARAGSASQTQGTVAGWQSPLRAAGRAAAVVIAAGGDPDRLGGRDAAVDPSLLVLLVHHPTRSYLHAGAGRRRMHCP